MGEVTNHKNTVAFDQSICKTYIPGLSQPRIGGSSLDITYKQGEWARQTGRTCAKNEDPRNFIMHALSHHHHHPDCLLTTMCCAMIISALQLLSASFFCPAYNNMLQVIRAQRPGQFWLERRKCSLIPEPSEIYYSVRGRSTGVHKVHDLICGPVTGVVRCDWAPWV